MRRTPLRRGHRYCHKARLPSRAKQILNMVLNVPDHWPIVTTEHSQEILSRSEYLDLKQAPVPPEVPHPAAAGAERVKIGREGMTGKHIASPNAKLYQSSHFLDVPAWRRLRILTRSFASILYFTSLKFHFRMPAEVGREPGLGLLVTLHPSLP